MKKLLLLLIICPLLSIGQIEAEKNIIKKQVSSEYIAIDTIDFFKFNDVTVDSIMLSYDLLPQGFSERYDSYYSQLADTLYFYTKDFNWILLVSRRIIIKQRVAKYVFIEQEKPDDKKIIDYLKKAKELNINNFTFWTHPKVQELLPQQDTIQ